MRKKRIRRELAALGHEPFEPTDEMRKQVRIYRFNGLGEQRIAALVGISHEELVYHFSEELEYSHDQIMAFLGDRALFLATQSQDLGVAQRATFHILQARSKLWRIPKDDQPDQGPDGQKAIGRMSLDEVEEELARMDERRRASVSTPGEEG